jgi:hypothetical protein
VKAMSKPKTATVYIYEDLQAVLASTRVVGGDNTTVQVLLIREMRPSDLTATP